MRREAVDDDFRREVREFVLPFVARYGRDPQGLWQDASWQAGLLARGWAVPTWPKEFGGANWTATQAHIWYSTLQAHFPGLAEPVGLSRVGPFLIQWGTPAAKARYLPGIRQFEANWCFAYFDAPSDPVVCRNDGRLLGCKQWVEGKDACELACVVVHDDGEGCRAFVLDAHALSWPDDTGLCVIDQGVQAAAMAAEITDTPQLARFLWSQAASVFGVSAALSEQLRLIRRLDPEMASKVAAAEVAVRALEALEWRTADALDKGTAPPVPADMLRLRGRELTNDIGALMVDSLGYYGLPQVDAVLLHNEGPIEPTPVHRGKQLVARHMLLEQARDRYEVAFKECAEAGQDTYNALFAKLQDSE